MGHLYTFGRHFHEPVQRFGHACITCLYGFSSPPFRITASYEGSAVRSDPTLIFILLLFGMGDSAIVHPTNVSMQAGTRCRYTFTESYSEYCATVSLLV